MNFVIVIFLLFRLIKTEIIFDENEIVNIDWKKYINSARLNAYDENIKSINGIENFNYLKFIDLKKNI